MLYTSGRKGRNRLREGSIEDQCVSLLCLKIGSSCNFISKGWVCLICRELSGDCISIIWNHGASADPREQMRPTPSRIQLPSAKISDENQRLSHGRGWCIHFAFQKHNGCHNFGLKSVYFSIHILFNFPPQC